MSYYNTYMISYYIGKMLLPCLLAIIGAVMLSSKGKTSLGIGMIVLTAVLSLLVSLLGFICGVITIILGKTAGKNDDNSNENKDV